MTKRLRHRARSHFLADRTDSPHVGSAPRHAAGPTIHLVVGRPARGHRDLAELVPRCHDRHRRIRRPEQKQQRNEDRDGPAERARSTEEGREDRPRSGREKIRGNGHRRKLTLLIGDQNDEPASGNDPTRTTEATNHRETGGHPTRNQRRESRRRCGLHIRTAGGLGLRCDVGRRGAGSSAARGRRSSLNHTNSRRGRSSRPNLRNSHGSPKGQRRCYAITNNRRQRRGRQPRRCQVRNSIHRGVRPGTDRGRSRRRRCPAVDRRRRRAGFHRRGAAAARGRDSSTRTVRGRRPHAAGENLSNQNRPINTPGLALPVNPAHLLRGHRKAELPTRLRPSERRRSVSFIHHQTPTATEAPERRTYNPRHPRTQVPPHPRTTNERGRRHPRPRAAPPT